ncbi:type II toxin-antitoxin system CcdA family antitoxin [Pseudomonas sp. NPDC089752]|uniref:type II toxin-antitoxin system CcdA family antitoxin n=1 Tax=Pseudomonas sp. NPDC089752 TaxID=3364472 RepID=UPI00380FEF8F
MPPSYGKSALKESVTLAISADLLARAVELGLNPSETLEKALAEAVSQREQEISRTAPQEVEGASSAEDIDPVLLAAATGLLGDEAKAVRWLTRPNSALGHKRLVDADHQKVLDVIARLSHGFCV